MTGDTPFDERRKIRGVIVEAKTLSEARRKFKLLELTAQEAIQSGEVDQFLDELDRRHRVRFDAGCNLKEFVTETWLPVCVEGGGLKNSQQESDKGILKNYIMPFFGRYGLREIDIQLIDRFKATLKRVKHHRGTGLSNRSVNNNLSVLKRILDKAQDYKLIDVHPMNKRVWMKIGASRKIPHWSPTEEAAVFKTLAMWDDEDEGIRLTITTQLVTGIRVSELRALKVGDLDVFGPGLNVVNSMSRDKIEKPKNGKERYQPLPRGLADQLRRWTKDRNEDDLLFPDPRGDFPLSKKVLNLRYRKLSDQAGVTRITSHGARHTSATVYSALGASQATIAKLLGHDDTSATEAYTHVGTELSRGFVDKRWARYNGAS